jgi:hypothetical protein
VASIDSGLTRNARSNSTRRASASRSKARPAFAGFSSVPNALQSVSWSGTPPVPIAASQPGTSTSNACVSR